MTVTGDPLVLADLRQRIADRGMVPFAEFMEVALYHPDGGYYTAREGRLGARGDYYTSPHVHPVFGALVAEQAWQVWQILGRPSPFVVGEVGGGAGLLAADLLRHAAHLDPSFAAALRLRMVEVSPALRRQQERALRAFDGAATWHATFRDAAPLHLVIANEVLDALPVHRLVVREGSPRELYVAWRDDGGFVEVEGPPSSARVETLAASIAPTAREGAVVEVQTAARDWVDQLAAALDPGCAIVVDYGWSERLGGAPRRDTLRCYYRHTCHDDPYVLVGLQDLTVDVDFDAIASYAAELGLRVAGPVTQRTFLHNLGIARYRSALPVLGLSRQEEHANRTALDELVRVGGLGGFLVLALARGLDPAALWGMTGRRVSAADDAVVRRADLWQPRLAWGRSEGLPDFAALWLDDEADGVS